VWRALQDDDQRGESTLVGAGGEAKLVALLQQLRAHPVTVTTGRGTGTVDDTYLRAVVNEYTEGAGDYPELDGVLTPTVAGDFGPMWNDVQDSIGRNPDGTYPGHGAGIARFFAIKCIDSPPTQTIAQYKAATAKAAKINPLTGAEDIWATTQCMHWPATTSMLPQKFVNAGQPPILLIGSSHDYRTPLAWAQTAARQIKSSSLIEADSNKHTS
jgi:TAP-like protein